MHPAQVGKLNVFILVLLIAVLSAGCKDSGSQTADPEISLPKPTPELRFLINQESWEHLPKHIQQVLKITRWTASFDMAVQSHMKVRRWTRISDQAYLNSQPKG